MTSTNGLVRSSRMENVLFGFTRILALGASLAALIGIVILLGLLAGGNDKTHVALNDLQLAAPAGQKSADQAASTSRLKVKVPSNVQRYMSGNNEKIMRSWIEDLDKTQQKDFIRNLSSIISQAEKSNINVIDTINAYKTAKLAKLHENPFEKYEQMVTRGAAIGAIFGLVIFIGLMILILVMLAIERNTRLARITDGQLGETAAGQDSTHGPIETSRPVEGLPA